MTILSVYEPLAFAPKATLTYDFPFEVATPESIEVFETYQRDDGSRFRLKVNPTQYSLDLKPILRYPLFRNGKVIFSRPHAETVQSIIIERNTLIDQTLDFDRFESFTTRMVEFAFDKAFIICQELIQRKCNSVTSQSLLQPLVVGSYRRILASSLNVTLNRIHLILQEIKNSADDCSESSTAATNETQQGSEIADEDDVRELTVSPSSPEGDGSDIPSPT